MRHVLIAIIALVSGCATETDPESVGTTTQELNKPNIACMQFELENTKYNINLNDNALNPGNSNLYKLDSVPPATIRLIARYFTKSCDLVTKITPPAYTSAPISVSIKTNGTTNVGIPVYSDCPLTASAVAKPALGNKGTLNIHIDLMNGKCSSPSTAKPAVVDTDAGSSTPATDAGTTPDTGAASKSTTPAPAPSAPVAPSSNQDKQNGPSDVFTGQVPSCPNGALCGGSSPVSCCESLYVPGGTFPMGRGIGSDACPAPLLTCWDGESPEHSVTVSGFYLDTFEVTVGRFRQFINQYAAPAVVGGANPRVVNSGWNAEWNTYLPVTNAAFKKAVKCSGTNWTDAVGANENKPMGCVNWYEAFAFCAWDGGRLPTTAEWEFAAAGGDENRLYPWGSAAPSSSLLVYLVPNVSTVGQKPEGRGKWGHYDLAGNVWERMFDVDDRLAYNWPTATLIDPANANWTCPECIRDRQLRGGGYGKLNSGIRSAARATGAASIRQDDFGFRCARN